MTPFTFAWYTILLLVVTNFIGLIYSILALYTNLFKSFAIQNKAYAPGIFLKRMPLYCFNLFLLLCISGLGAYYGFPLFDTLSSNVWIIIIQVIVAFVFDDIYFYFMHRWLHQNKFMLKHVHAIHHRASKPFPLEYLYAHPFEWMLGMVGAFLGFGLILLFMPINMYAFWIFGALRNLHEIHIHSDLDLPISNQLPGLSKTKHHDDHHAKLTGNYSSTFMWMDRIFKTNF